MKPAFQTAVLRAAIATLAVSLSCVLPPAAKAATPSTAPRVQLAAGLVEGTDAEVDGSPLSVFQGIPYAAPPTGSLRWREPQPVARWAGVRRTVKFGPRCMQLQPSHGTSFRSEQMSEDCLYLNVWSPARGENAKLPVLVYFHSGGFAAGDGSEGRYDGASLAARGIVVVTVNYRLGVFGFLALPDAALESPHGAAGNYGLLDQHAALRWVRENIAQFGGDPEQVTIGGQSTGSIAVSAHMASPLSRGLFARAIGESGGAFAPLKLWRRSEAETAATLFADHFGAQSLQELRSMTAEKLLAATEPEHKPVFNFWPHIDGYFLRDTPESVFRAGAQAHVPLLLGTNSQERHFRLVLADSAPTSDNWHHVMRQLFRERAEEALAFYPGNDNEEVMRSGTALAGDLFVSHSAWRWMDLHRQTGRAPVYFYRYTHPRPAEVEPTQQSNDDRHFVTGAVHAAEIEYALGNLRHSPLYAWRAEDHEVSRVFSGYIAQFVKTGDPNDRALPHWPAAREERRGIARQVIHTTTHTTWDDSGPRQAFMQQIFADRLLDTGADR
jgi:para-nitrobenzyl esterase